MNTKDERRRFLKLANEAPADSIRKAHFERAYLFACREQKARRLGIPPEQLPAEDEGDRILVLSGTMIAVDIEKVINEKLDKLKDGNVSELDLEEGENETE